MFIFYFFFFFIFFFFFPSYRNSNNYFSHNKSLENDSHSNISLCSRKNLVKTTLSTFEMLLFYFILLKILVEKNFISHLNITITLLYFHCITLKKNF